MTDLFSRVVAFWEGLETHERFILVLLLMLLLWLLYQLLKRLLRGRKRSKQSQRQGQGQQGAPAGGGGQQGAGSGESSESEASKAGQQRATEEAIRRRRAEQQRRHAEEQRRADTVEEVVKQDSRLGEAALREADKRAGRSTSTLQDTSSSRAAAERIAKNLPKQHIDVFRVAATQKDIVLDIESGIQRNAVLYPTDDMEPIRVSDAERIVDIIPEDQMLEDDMFYERLVAGEVSALQSYETVQLQKLLYVLVDVSGSMREPMQDGYSRHVWSRGVVMNLLLKAVDGDSQYCLRFFDGAPHQLLYARTPEEAQALLPVILNSSLTSAGTHILAALSQAADDISKREDITDAEILLISDGEDGSVSDPEVVRQVIGSKMRLHAVLLGSQSPSLEKAADTYQHLP